MITIPYKPIKYPKVGRCAQITKSAALLGVPWGSVGLVTEIDSCFAKARILLGEKLYVVHPENLTRIESEEDMFSMEEWKHAKDCMALERYQAACAAIQALK